MSKAKPYSRESIAHALAHHESRGVLRTVSPPATGTPRWRVTFAAGGASPVDDLDMTEREAYVACIMLAACERHARAEHERFVRELSQRDGPICLDDELEHEVALLRRVLRVGNVAAADDPDLGPVLRRALDEVKRRTTCGIHGDDTTNGRCFTCDVGWLRVQLARLDEAATLTDAEGPYAAVLAVCERQPRLIPVVLAWARTEHSGVTS